jgi:hypothetical protein
MPLRAYEELIWSELATTGAARLTMPLRAYFVAVGATFLALLLLLNLVLEPRKPANPSPAQADLAAAVLKSTATPRWTTGSAQPSGTAFLTARGVEPQHQLPTSSPEPQLSMAKVERKSVTRAKPAQARVTNHSVTAARRHSGYESNAWNVSAATKHGPE